MMGAGSKNYYTNLAQEDYYLCGGEPLGHWMGKGACALGLQGTVQAEMFKNLFQGYSPDGKEKLVQNAGSDQRRSGYDLTFSAPKSVSVIWSQGDSQTRHLIQNAQKRAVETALNYLESHTITRMGKGGHLHVPARLVVATFEHGTSRAIDPQLHTHALVLNVAVRFDGSTGTIENNALYRHKMLAGAIYRAELARELQQNLGLRAEKVKTWFEIKGVNSKLIQEFSQRRQAIEEYLAQHNQKTAKAAEVAALKTREVKGHVARQDLFSQWQTIGKKFGYQMPKPDLILSKPGQELMIAQKALQQIMVDNAHFSERELLLKTAIEAPELALSWAEVQRGVQQCLEQSTVVALGKDSLGERRFTTTEMLGIEKRLLKQAESTQQRYSHSYLASLGRQRAEGRRQKVGLSVERPYCLPSIWV